MDTHKFSIMGAPSPELDAKWEELTQCKPCITENLRYSLNVCFFVQFSSLSTPTKI